MPLASTFSLVFPLVAPAAALLLLLTLIGACLMSGLLLQWRRPNFVILAAAHRFLVGYVYGRTRSQTGGLLQMWLIQRFGTLLAFQPLVLGLILLRLIA